MLNVVFLRGFFFFYWVLFFQTYIHLIQMHGMVCFQVCSRKITLIAKRVECTFQDFLQKIIRNVFLKLKAVGIKCLFFLITNGTGFVFFSIFSALALIKLFKLTLSSQHIHEQKHREALHKLQLIKQF